MFYISLENSWYQGCYGGMKIMCFYFLIIDLKVSLNLNMFFLLIMRALLNIVCFTPFSMGLKVSLKLKIIIDTLFFLILRNLLKILMYGVIN